MKLGIRKSFRILAPGNSLRRRTAYSLALVRLILAPVIFLTVYYLFEMGWIVDRIVNVDAPAATLAQQASTEMLEARRAERNYFLLHNQSSLETNAAALKKTEEILNNISTLEPDDKLRVQKASEALTIYQQQLAAAVTALGRPGVGPTDRIQAVVKDYERDLDDVLKRSRRSKREQLIDELRKRVDSFDAQISETVQGGNPELQRVTEDLKTSSQLILEQASILESADWGRVQRDHAEARRLIRQAEWALGIVSALTLIISTWVSYILPRQVVKPLLKLKEAIDHAAEENYEIDFEVQGKGEIVDLVESLRHMLAALRAKA
jgi:methyl-accepting chemotaxis protein